MKQRILLMAFVLLACIGTAYGQKNIGDKVKGKASYYHNKFHGRKTASGEVYDKFGMTAAHRTLPYGTMLKVTNTKNGRSVDVKVNDRGPFSKDRLIDLSFAAASKIDMIRDGVATLEVEVISVPGQEVPATSEEAIAKNDPKEDASAKEKAAKEKADKEKADKEKADKEKAEKEKAAQKPGKDDDVRTGELAKKTAEKIEKVTAKAEAVKEAVASIKKEVDDALPAKKIAAGRSYSIWGTEQKPKGYGIQIGLYSSLEEAKKVGKEAIDLGMKPLVIQVGWENNEEVYRVVYGEKGNADDMRKSLDYVKSKGFNGFVKKHFD